jgi:hypothetical protein
MPQAKLMANIPFSLYENSDESWFAVVPPPLEPELPPNTYTTLNFDKLIKQH